ncbi:MAG: hypothetical protein LIP11_16515 [Clostridiales bacterium]|nr:hypothetical protein [Clostridiales bacterium]
MLQPAAIFQDGMILQREKIVTVWGTHTPGAVVSVEIQGQNAKTIADEKGTRYLTRPARSACEADQTLTCAEGETISYP